MTYSTATLISSLEDVQRVLASNRLLLDFVYYEFNKDV